MFSHALTLALAFFGSDPALGAGVPSRPLSPAEALATFRLPPGYRIELVASEPLIADPVAVAYDEDGRLYVAEMADYPFGPPKGRIKRLEDADGDGRMEKATLYATDVPTPLGLLPWKGGLIVAASPDILYLKDADGDGRAERREVWLTGFVEGNPQHRVNGLQLGIDNWIYGANGDSGGKIRRPRDAESAAVAIRGTDFRFRPDLSALEPVEGQSQYANTFDDWGRRFINNNSNHAMYAVLPLRYLGRNPHLTVSAVQESIPEHGPAAQIFPAGPIAERFNDYNMAGHFTSACSITIYRGTTFPAEARGNAFVCEPVHNLVHRDVLEEKGTSFVARRAASERQSEFLASTDNWFRPVNVATTPEGDLLVVDFYRAVIEHPQWIPLEVQRRVDLRAGEDKGRIWRVSFGEAGVAPRAARPRLSAASTAELVAALAHPNGWWRSTAQRLLLERQDKTAVPGLVRLLRANGSGASPLGRLHALWMLDGLGALQPAHVTAALADKEAHVREHGLRLAEPWLRESGASPGAGAARAGDRAMIARKAAALADDGAARVRFQAALSLGELPARERVAPLARLAVRDAEDRWARLALLSSVARVERALLERLSETSPRFLEPPSPGAAELVARLGELVAARRDRSEIAGWLAFVAGAKTATRSATAPRAPALARWRRVAVTAVAGPLARAGLLANDVLKEAGLETQAAALAADALAAARDGSLPPGERVAAVDLVAWLRTDDAAEALLELLKPQEPAELQVATVRALVNANGAASGGAARGAAAATGAGGATGDRMGDRLLARFASMTGAARRELLRALLSRPERTQALLAKLEAGDIAPLELGPEQRDRLLKDDRAAVRERARKIFQARSSAEIDKAAETSARRVLALKGDGVRGEKVYTNICSPCHRLHGQGHKLGPGLESVATREPRALIEDILNPNRAMDPAYQMYVVKTPTQDMVTGVIAAETPTSVTLRRPLSDESTILRKEIVEMKAWPTSMMPEGLEKSLSDQDLADLLALLRGAGRPQ